jgi:hypothetical protein
MKKTLCISNRSCSIIGIHSNTGGFMRLHTSLGVVSLLAAGLSANGSSFVIDNFSCPDTVTLDGPAGPTAFNANWISCPGSIGGEREDFIGLLTGAGASGGSASSISTISTNPPANAITGTFGSGITGFEGMQWSGSTLDSDLPNLNLVGDSILVQIKSDMGGSLFAYFGSGPVGSPDSSNLLEFTTTFAASSSYQDVLIPLTGTPMVLGTGASLDGVTDILLNVSMAGAGGTWTIDGVAAVPEPSTLLLTGICFLGILTRSIWRGSSRP